MPWVAQKRLIAAIVASAALHATIISLPSGGARGERAGFAPLTVLLGEALPQLHQEAPPLLPQPIKHVIEATANVALPVHVTRPAVTLTAPLRAAGASESTHNIDGTHVPEARDPAIYTALQLDEYPRALTTLELKDVGTAPGKLRATVMIDEAGVVNSVRNVQAAPADVQQAATHLLLASRFAPARRDGRAVKAQVVVELAYGSARVE